MTEQQLTHIDEHGDVRMVDVSQKADTERVAVAEGFIAMNPATLALIVEGKAAKGDVLACARVADVYKRQPLRFSVMLQDRGRFRQTMSMSISMGIPGAGRRQLRIQLLLFRATKLQ